MKIRTTVGLFVGSMLLGASVYAKMQALGVGFAAPTINGEGNVDGPEKGAIIFDSSSSTFKGNKGTPGSPDWVSMSASAGALPAGMVIMTASGSCPSGTIPADGDSLVRTDHQELFDAIGITYGAVDATHFTVPNAKGVFIRGAGTQTISTITYTGSQGTSQRDEFQGHQHRPTTNAANQSLGFAVGTYAYSQSNSAGSVDNALNVGNPVQGSNGQVRFGSETRPANITLLYCIVE